MWQEDLWGGVVVVTGGLGSSQDSAPAKHHCYHVGPGACVIGVSLGTQTLGLSLLSLVQTGLGTTPSSPHGLGLNTSFWFCI